MTAFTSGRKQGIIKEFRRVIQVFFYWLNLLYDDESWTLINQPVFKYFTMNTSDNKVLAWKCNSCQKK